MLICKIEIKKITTATPSRLQMQNVVRNQTYMEVKALKTGITASLRNILQRLNRQNLSISPLKIENKNFSRKKLFPLLRVENARLCWSRFPHFLRSFSIMYTHYLLYPKSYNEIEKYAIYIIGLGCGKRGIRNHLKPRCHSRSAMI